jgi:UDP-2-acetamido-2,6-beta-L-arabino-hexul-4-ose reductase
MYQLHNNETGSFQELAHATDVKFGQLSILKINPGSARGGHYHSRKEEWFCCIHGKCEMKLNNVKDGSSRIIILEETNKEFVMIKPYESHILTNPSNSEECEVLIIISEVYDPVNPDTIRYDG